MIIETKREWNNMLIFYSMFAVRMTEASIEEKRTECSNQTELQMHLKLSG